MLVNNKLSWTDHTEHILQQFTDRFNLVRRTTHFVNNTNQRRILFLTLVRSLLEHCSPVWAPQSVGLLDSLEAAQKRSIKWVLGVSHLTSWSDQTYHSHLSTLSILPIHLQLKYNDMKLMYKVMTGLVPVILPNYLYIKSLNDVSYTTRSNKNIIDNTDLTTLCCTVKPSSAVFRNSYFYRSFSYWNSLSVTIRQSPTFSTFCYRLRSHLFTSISSP